MRDNNSDRKSKRSVKSKKNKADEKKSLLPKDNN